MGQLSLFDNDSAGTGIYGNPLSRRSDPETSKKAEARVDLVGNFKLFVDALSKSNYPQTAQEVAADAIPFDPEIPVGTTLAKRESVRKRAKELVNRKVIRVKGTRICQVTGNESTTYEVVGHPNPKAL
jgi:hypothetical protein